jgi:nucleoside-diphosphate-sugar epimerase
MVPTVKEDLRNITQADVPWDAFRNKTVLITGANGFLPAYMVETLLFLNQVRASQNTHVVALVRNLDKAQRRFQHYQGQAALEFLVQDVCGPLPPHLRADYIIHAASQATPRVYGNDPVGTLLPNVVGTYHLLELALACGAEGFLFVSSSEVYGQIDPTRSRLAEEDYAGLSSTEVRSCYAESKRMGETMCVAWAHQYQVPTKIVRPFVVYGPGMQLDDGRVFADFVSDVVQRRPIVVKSAGTAVRSFCYLADATVAFFTVLLKGAIGNAYNVANDRGECSIAELAGLLVKLFPERQLSVAFQARPEGAGYIASKVSRLCADISKVRGLGWQPTTGLAEGFRRTVRSFE